QACSRPRVLVPKWKPDGLGPYRSANGSNQRDRAIQDGCLAPIFDHSKIMKVMTIFGTRPEIIRLSLIMKVLDQHCDHVMVHTGQNFDASLSDVFFSELEI